MVRWKYFAPFLVGMILLGVGAFTAPVWIRWSLEKSGTLANKAKVEIDSVRIGVFPLKLHIANLQVTNPKSPFRNRVQVNSIELDIHTRALLEKKFIINLVAVQGISLDTPRKTSGALKRPIPPTPKSALTQELEGRLWGQLGQIATILPEIKAPKPEQLKAVKAYEEAAQDLRQTQAKWDQIIKGKTIEKELQTLNASVEALHKTSQEPIVLPRDLGKLQTTIQHVQTTLKQVDELSKKVNQTQKAFETDSARLTGRVGQIQVAAKADVSETMQMFKLKKPKFNFGSAYLLEPIQTRLLPIMDSFRKVLAYKDKVSIPKPRLKLRRDGGEDIAFQKPQEFPKLWIKKILITGRGLQGEWIEGEIEHICSAPLDIQKPLVAQLTGSHLFRSQASFQLQFEQYPVGQLKRNTIVLAVKNVPLPPQPIIQKNGQEIRLSSAAISFTSRSTLLGSYLDSRTQLLVSPIRMMTVGIDSTQWTMESVLADVLKPIQALSIGLNLKGPYRKLHPDIHSNIDEQIAAALDQAFQKRLALAQAQLQQQVDAAIAQKQAEVDQQLAAYRAQVQGWMDLQVKQVNALHRELEEIQKKAEKQANDKVDSVKKDVESQLSNQLKNLFR